MKSRYCYCPMTAKKIGRRVTILEQIRQRFRKKVVPDLYRVTGFEQAIFPSKK